MSKVFWEKNPLSRWMDSRWPGLEMTLTLENATFADFCETSVDDGWKESRKVGKKNICICYICHTNHEAFISKGRSEPCLQNNCQGVEWFKHRGIWFILCLVFSCKICSHWEWWVHQSLGKKEKAPRSPETTERMMERQQWGAVLALSGWCWSSPTSWATTVRWPLSSALDVDNLIWFSLQLG